MRFDEVEKVGSLLVAAVARVLTIDCLDDVESVLKDCVSDCIVRRIEVGEEIDQEREGL